MPELDPSPPLPFTFRDAYSRAPRLLDETAAVTRLQALVGDADSTPDELREYLLRYAALADRQAETTGDQHDINEAERTAEQLLNHDRQHGVTAGSTDKTTRCGPATAAAATSARNTPPGTPTTSANLPAPLAKGSP
ncbi:hypothetical protein [Streptomyces sp. NPDC051173]|uniref:hypothetical protein n=1 Tax=Streptomyces sp. NPDC051173 TaxID=3155164 RepID=UPI00344C083F